MCTDAEIVTDFVVMWNNNYYSVVVFTGMGAFIEVILREMYQCSGSGSCDTEAHTLGNPS